MSLLERCSRADATSELPYPTKTDTNTVFGKCTVVLWGSISIVSRSRDDAPYARCFNHIDIGYKAHCSHHGEGTNVSFLKRFLYARRGGQQRASFRDNIVNEKYPCRFQQFILNRY